MKTWIVYAVLAEQVTVYGAGTFGTCRGIAEHHAGRELSFVPERSTLWVSGSYRIAIVELP